MTKNLSLLFILLIAALVPEIARSLPSNSKVSYIDRTTPHGRTLLISGSRPGVGRIRGKLLLKESSSIPLIEVRSGSVTRSELPVNFLEGPVTLRRLSGDLPISSLGAAIDDASGIAEVYLPLANRRGTRSITLRLRARGASGPRISYPRRDRTLLCPLDAASNTRTPYGYSSVRRVFAGPATIVLAVDIDSRFNKLNGSGTALAAALTLKRTNTIYQNTFGYSFRIGALTVFADKGSDPVGAKFSTSEDLLEAYRLFRIATPVAGADLYHLFTAQRGFLDAIGLAQIGAACAVPEFSVAWSDYASGFFVFSQTVAHEIGHNLNATHDPTDPHSLMSASGKANVKNPYFSPFSQNEITAFVAQNGSCLADTSGSDLPTPSSESYRTKYERRSAIKLTAKLIRCGKGSCISGKISKRTGAGLAGRIIELLTFSPSTLLKTKSSNKRGSFTFKLPGRGNFYVTDRLSLTGSELFTKR